MMLKKKRGQRQIKQSKKYKKVGLKDLKHKPFWGVFTVVFLLSSLIILGSMAGIINITGHATIQQISFLKGGSELFTEVRDIKGVKFATTHLTDDIKDGKVTFTESDRILFKGKTYSKFTVSSADEDKIGKIDLTLKIKKKDLLTIGISQTDLRLYVNGNEVKTTFTNEEGNYLYFTATSDQMGDYVIGLKAKEEHKPSVSSTGKAAEQSAPSVLEVSEPEPEVEEESVPPIVEQPAPVKKTFFGKVADFFKGLFS